MIASTNQQDLSTKKWSSPGQAPIAISKLEIHRKKGNTWAFERSSANKTALLWWFYLMKRPCVTTTKKTRPQ